MIVCDVPVNSKCTGCDKLGSAIFSTRLTNRSLVNAELRAVLNDLTIDPLQRAQNAAALLVFGLRSHDHITPALAQLHWLPVQFRIKFKLCLLMHQIHVGRCPAYLAELVSSSAENCRRPGLRSTSSSVYSKPRLRTKFAERAFSFSGPAEWNCLSSDLL